MDNSTPDILVRYLDGELSGADKAEFESELARNSQLREAYEKLVGLRAGIRLQGLQQQVAGIHNEMMKELKPGVVPLTGNRPHRKRYVLAIAASLVLIIGAYFLYQSVSASPAKLYADYYTTYELATVRDTGQGDTKLVEAYREKRYDQVVRMHDAGEDHSTQGEFLCGAAALEKADYTKATQCFREVLQSVLETGSTQWKDEAEYYLSLSYIRTKNYKAALALLESISRDESHTYYDKVSSKLLRQVRKLEK